MRRRNYQKKIYLNEMEKNILEMTAEKTGLSQSDILRLLIVGGRPKEKPGDRFYMIMEDIRLEIKDLQKIVKKYSPNEPEIKSIIEKLDKMRVEILDEVICHDISEEGLWRLQDFGK